MPAERLLHKIVLGPRRSKERRAVVYVGRLALTRKYINGWVEFKKGVPVPVPDDWARALVKLGDNAGPMFQYYEGGPVTGTANYAVKRNMGLGDVILVTPTLRAMKAAWPWANVRYYTEARYMPVLRHNPDAEILELGREKDNTLMFDLIGVSETDSSRMFVERVDVYARHVGVVLDDRAPRLYVSDEERAAGAARLKEFGWDGVRPLLGVQLISSRPERDYSLGRAMQVLAEMYRRGWAVALFHNSEIDWAWGFPVVDLTGHTGTTNALADCVSNCRLFLGVDSGVTHMAAALGVPTLALCGPIRGGLRYNCYPNAAVMEKGDFPCVQKPHECYSCHKGRAVCMEFAPADVVAQLGGMV